MRIRILDLDGSVQSQGDLTARHELIVFPARSWGPYVRLACSWTTFRRFQTALSDFCNGFFGRPQLTLYGSGDFHHVSLALLGMQRQPINLLVLDNHPDWMRGVPFLHCGTWVYHAALLPWVERIFHVGGDVDFDNYYQWMAPWRLLRSGKIVVIPALRQFKGGSWKAIAHAALWEQPDKELDLYRLRQLLKPFSAELAARPLYVSLDKDVMTREEAIVNWDSGHLRLREVQKILEVFLSEANGRLAGMDITGDWSPVEVRGLFRHFIHWTEHPALCINREEAVQQNQALNLSLIQTVDELAPQEVAR
jgi:Arginase family